MPETRSALDPSNLPVRDDVAEVRGDLHAERHRQPDRIELVQLVEDDLEPRGPRNPDHGPQCQAGTEQDEERVLCGVALQMGRGSEKSSDFHLGVESASTLAPLTPLGLRRVVVAVSPHAPHGETRAAEDSDKAQFLVSRPAVPEVETKHRDDR